MSKKSLSLRDRQKADTLLKSGMPELGIADDYVQREKLLNYLALLIKWNTTYNLTAIREPEAMLKQHLLDSLSVVPCFSDCRNLLDVGSGGGLPGLVVAIVRPELPVSVIDIVHKKTAFMNQAKIELGLENVTVYTGRVEELATETKFDAIVSRAFSSLSDFIRLSGHLLKEDGRFYAMKGLIPMNEIGNLDPEWTVRKVKPLKIPGLDAQRHVIIVGKNR